MDLDTPETCLLESPEPLDSPYLAPESSLIVSINPLTPDQSSQLGEGIGTLSFVLKNQQPECFDALVENGISVCSIESVPRTSAGQPMDALSSIAKVAGYRAVVEAVKEIGRFIAPTATASSGPIPAVNVFVIGVGVSLGANVKAFDPRPAVRQQVESLGGEFIEMGISTSETGGYAEELEEDFLLREQKLIAHECKTSNIIISSAAIPGKTAPILITDQALCALPTGSVIVDLSAGSGGNCIATVPDETITTPHGVTIIGDTNITRRMPTQASELYAANVFAILKQFGGGDLDTFNMCPDDPVIGRMVLAKRGVLIEHPPLPNPKPPQEPAEGVPCETILAPTRKHWSRQSIFLLAAVILLAALVGLAIITPRTAAGMDFLRQFFLFVLAIIASVYVTLRVTTGLQSPLMSLTNSITGLVVVGGLLQVARATNPWALSGILAVIAIFLASINLGGGYFVTCL
ncbi:hypothetical protein RCL1_000638 [Eukaryota sp. TZLM3-RCL]